MPEYTGPHLGPRMAQENRRVFSEEVVVQGRRLSGMSGVTAGSSGVMERTHIETIPFGADMESFK